MGARSADFSARLVQWQASSGRNDLPWQNTREPYRVWLSEIMLQQTQVSTVLKYYERFLAHFPDLRSLAQATQDEVLSLWSGLGYYGRARNLHRCAQQLAQGHGAEFPRSARELQELPGIGRSTAAAIAAFCHGERVAILDGNVKRVLSRVLGFDADLSVAAHQGALWERAQQLLPVAGPAMQRYTQGLMDLGATLCSRTQPNCAQCPVRDLCVAHAAGRPHSYPVKTRKLKRSVESIWLLWAQGEDGAAWLARRPDRGVWAGLHCLPTFASEQSLLEALPERCRSQVLALPVLRHALTHKDLFLHPVRMAASVGTALTLEGGWVGASHWPALGLPAPIRALLAG
ncbi:MAG: A/G-specific adenine glycosylase [Betaproteobacteria bacterium]